MTQLPLHEPCSIILMKAGYWSMNAIQGDSVTWRV